MLIIKLNLQGFDPTIPKNMRLKCFFGYKISFKNIQKLIWKLFRGFVYFRPQTSRKSEPVFDYKRYVYKKDVHAYTY